jgi:ATP/maltotriose-dependent transcriptional regulator MalT
LRRGHRTGQFLAADPDGDDRDEQGEQRDCGRCEEPAGEPCGQSVRRELGGGLGGLAAEDQSSLPPAEELSPGELRVLRYLPTNLSRPEIAGELSVSLNTVSTHLRSIYAKLQVRDRSSAVQRARELRLLAARRTR